MLTNPTLDKLQVLGLMGMASALSDQLQQPEHQALSFEQRLGLMVDREMLERENRRLQRNLKGAKLRTSSACLEDVDYQHPRGLDRGLLLDLASGQWVAAHRNALIVGPTGNAAYYVSF